MKKYLYRVSLCPRWYWISHPWSVEIKTGTWKTRENVNDRKKAKYILPISLPESLASLVLLHHKITNKTYCKGLQEGHLICHTAQIHVHFTYYLYGLTVRAVVRHNNASKQYTVETHIKVTHWQRDHQVVMRVFLGDFCFWWPR